MLIIRNEVAQERRVTVFHLPVAASDELVLVVVARDSVNELSARIVRYGNQRQELQCGGIQQRGIHFVALKGRPQSGASIACGDFAKVAAQRGGRREAIDVWRRGHTSERCLGCCGKGKL